MKTTEDHSITPLSAATEGGQDHKSTKPKKWFVIAAILSAVLLATAAYVTQTLRHLSRAGGEADAEAGSRAVLSLDQLAGSGHGFGPVVEVMLPAARGDGKTEILNLKTGRWLTQPSLGYFHDDARALRTWIRTNGLNISGRVWPDGSATCVTYNMAAVPVETKCWEETAAGDLPVIPVLAPDQHSPRRLLVLRPGRTQTYAFRTDEGTTGILYLLGLSDDGCGVRIQYKLVPARGEVAQHIATP
jgi:hypothetical protein